MEPTIKIFTPNPFIRIGGVLTALFGISLGAALFEPEFVPAVAAAIPAFALLFVGWRIATSSLRYDNEEVIVRNVVQTKRIRVEHARVLGLRDDARTSSRWGVASRKAPVMADDNTVLEARLLRLVDDREPTREISVAASVGRSPKTFDAGINKLLAIIQAPATA